MAPFFIDDYDSGASQLSNGMSFAVGQLGANITTLRIDGRLLKKT